LTLRVRVAVPARLRVRVADRVRVREPLRVRVALALRDADGEPMRLRAFVALPEAIRVLDTALEGVRVTDARADGEDEDGRTEGLGLCVAPAGSEKLARPQLLPATLLQLGVKHSMTS